jgi:DNA-binding NtrC family response regulator
MNLYILTDARTPSLRMAAEHLRHPSNRRKHKGIYPELHKELFCETAGTDALQPARVLWARHKTVADKLRALTTEDINKGDQVVITVPKIDEDQIPKVAKALNQMRRKGVEIFWFSAPEWFDRGNTVPGACEGIKGVNRFTNPFYEKIENNNGPIGELIDYIEYKLAHIFMEPELADGSKMNEEEILLEIVITLSKSAETCFATPSNLIIAQPGTESTKSSNPYTLCTRFKEKGYPSFAGNSRIIEQFKERLLRLAISDRNVLIIGETGTGKENAAYFLHEFSPRRKKPFLALNCAGKEDPLLESELFGHKKGAFTGADREKEGMIKKANGGTLFLDELPDASQRFQAKLLRFLECGEFYAVGSSTKETVDVKIVAGAQLELLKEKKTRLDFLTRIAQSHLVTPSLYELIENNRTREPDKEPDIVTMARNQAARLISKTRVNPNRTATCFTHEDLVGIWEELGTPEIREALMGYSWPGNVRELKNVISEWICVGHSLEEAITAPTTLAARLSGDTVKVAGEQNAPCTDWTTFDGPDGQPLVSFRPVNSLHELATANKIASMYVRHVHSSLAAKGFTQKEIGKQIEIKHNNTYAKYKKG